MNMEKNPTEAELRELIRGCNDRKGHHMLWVAENGDVKVSTVAEPVSVEQSQPGVRLRYETFQAGNEYVGPEAAEDADWIKQLFRSLTQKWPTAKSQGEYVSLDEF